jgi:hypothetical protein
MRIIYKNDAGGVSIITPSPEALALYGIETIAQKDVPAGKPYKIVALDAFPLDGTFNEHGEPNMDKTFRAAWEVDEADLTDGVGADSNEFEGVAE